MKAIKIGTRVIVYSVDEKDGGYEYDSFTGMVVGRKTKFGRVPVLINKGIDAEGGNERGHTLYFRPQDLKERK